MMIQMNTWFLNQRCPKCGGNLFFQEDSYIEGDLVGFYKHESCLQCGYECHNNYNNLVIEGQETKTERQEPLPV
jgi:hypothetical protein